MNSVMFGEGCSTNLLQKVFNAVANNKEWDFIGMTHEVNSDYKGLVSTFRLQPSANSPIVGIEASGR